MAKRYKVVRNFSATRGVYHQVGDIYEGNLAEALLAQKLIEPMEGKSEQPAEQASVKPLEKPKAKKSSKQPDGDGPAAA